MAQKAALVAVGDGSEEIETTTITDVLARAGAAVTLASVGAGAAVTMSRGVRLTADARVADLPPDAPFDVVVLPGGLGGAERLRDCAPLVDRVRRALAADAGPLVGAICAAPAVVLAPHGLLAGRAATCYPAPAFEDKMDNYKPGVDVVVSDDRKLVTSRGPATAMPFALTLVEMLYGKDLARKLASELLCTSY